MRGRRVVASSSRYRRRSPGSPRTSARSSGANRTARSTPRISRAARTGERFSRALFARPALISTSIASSRPSLTTIVDTTARSVPARINGASVATRCEPSVDEYHSASTRFVLPKPFGPTNTVRPGSRSNSTRGHDRKSVNPRWRTYTYPDSLTRLTAWPPNWFRNADTAFIVGESSCRDRNRANNDAAMPGTGTRSRIASSTVQRPSPESSV